MLLAEDDSNDELLLRLAFAKAAPEANLRGFGDGEDLVNFMGRNLPGGGRAGKDARLLLLDLRMPRIDGFSVLRWLGENPECRPDNVVVWTGLACPKELQDALDLGADALISKPQDAAQLPQVVKSLRRFCKGDADALAAFHDPPAELYHE